MKKLLTVLAGSITMAATAAMAGAPVPAPAPAPSDSGIYANVNIGYGDFDVDGPGDDVPGIDVTDTGFMWSANIGYQFNQYFAFEVGYMQVPQYKISGLVFNTPVSVKINVDAWLFALKVMYPLSNQFDIFAKLGGAYQVAHGRISIDLPGGSVDGDSLGSDDQFAPYFALGFDYMLTPNWSFNVQGVVIVGVNGWPTTYGGLVGVSYLFNL